jgi:hypothetical protein
VKKSRGSGRDRSTPLCTCYREAQNTARRNRPVSAVPSSVHVSCLLSLRVDGQRLCRPTSAPRAAEKIAGRRSRGRPTARGRLTTALPLQTRPGLVQEHSNEDAAAGVSPAPVCATVNPSLSGQRQVTRAGLLDCGATAAERSGVQTKTFLKRR